MSTKQILEYDSLNQVENKKTKGSTKAAVLKAIHWSSSETMW